MRFVIDEQNKTASRRAVSPTLNLAQNEPVITVVAHLPKRRRFTGAAWARGYNDGVSGWAGQRVSPVVA
jgi:hypothetical protein